MELYCLLTKIGQAKVANAIALHTQVAITQFGIGDGNGQPVTPTESMTALVHEVYRGPISSVHIDGSNPNWMVAEVNIASNVGGWTAREGALFDEDGDMFAVANIADSYKPVIAEGSAKEMIFRIIVQVSNASNVILQIDPAIVLASKAYVDNALEVHEADVNAHVLYRRPALRAYL